MNRYKGTDSTFEDMQPNGRYWREKEVEMSSEADSSDTGIGNQPGLHYNSVLRIHNHVFF